jgi:AraC-like DNA-binding protein
MLPTALSSSDAPAEAAPAAVGLGVLPISRWFTMEPASCQTQQSSRDEHLVSLCLRATRLELRSGAGAAFDGVMRAGALHVTGPGRQIAARFSGPCDILHLHVPTTLLEARLTGMGAEPEALGGLDGCTLSDPLVEQLAKLLVSDAARADTIYATAISQTLLTRILHLAQNRAPVGALAKWRLRRVQSLVDAQLSEPLTLSDMAAAAGLSRMHFAAQFRVATGSSPHEYLLCQRIEAAKALLAETEISLAEIALSVGFLAQAHFTTVFKRLSGETPARWRRACRDTGLALVAARDLRRDPGLSDTLHNGALA